MDFKRKAYDDLINWKRKKNHQPLIVEGLRQVGKSYIVSKFCMENYENVVEYDFRGNKEIRKVFDGDLDINEIIRRTLLYKPEAKFVPDKTVLIFEEISDCPKARTSLKYFSKRLFRF